MSEAAPLRLKRVRAGKYQTLDGRFTILRDPHCGSLPGGWGYNSWLVYKGEVDVPFWLGQEWIHPSLRALRQALSNHLAKEANG